jgi:hypothetical protein
LTSGEEETDVPFEVSSDCEGDEFTVEGQAEYMAGARWSHRGAESVSVGGQELIPVEVTDGVGEVSGGVEECVGPGIQ